MLTLFNTTELWVILTLLFIMVIFVIKIISSYTYQFGPRQVRNLKQCNAAQRQRSLYVDFSSYDYSTGTTI